MGKGEAYYDKEEKLRLKNKSHHVWKISKRTRDWVIGMDEGERLVGTDAIVEQRSTTGRFAKA